MGYRYTVSFSDKEWCNYTSHKPQKWISLASELLQDQYQQLDDEMSSQRKYQMLAINNQLALIDAVYERMQMEKDLVMLQKQVAKQEAMIKELEDQLNVTAHDDLNKELQKAKILGSESYLKDVQERLNQVSKEKIKRKNQ